jgi:homogentisate 1,2-dioxygenase
MARTFSTRQGPTRVVFGCGVAETLAKELAALDAPPKKVLVVSTPRRKRDAEAIGSRLGSIEPEILAIAREHVPEDTVNAAESAAARVGADGLVAFGGGSAIGLAKAVAVRSRSSMPVVAIPTTYSGSEMTPIYGVTADGRKRTGRDERARPALVIYDPALTYSLQRATTMTSLWNAMAHAVEALWMPGVDRGALVTAEEALRLLVASARRLTQDLEDHDARADALEGAYLAGGTFGDLGSGLHHKLCHVLGGRFGMPHGPTHAALLGHVARFYSAVATDAMARVARALGVLDPVSGLDRLADETSIERSLAALGFPATEEAIRAVVDDVLATPPRSVRALERAALHDLLVEASAPPRAPKAGRERAALRVPASIGQQPGFGSTHESEALEGALPRRQNAPRPPPYGLYPELLSGTPFTVKNAQNSRVWMYRIRPSFSHGVYHPLPAGRFAAAYTEIEPNRTRWAPLPIPPASERVDFLDGLATLGGEGSPTGPGYAIHLYAANADMVDRAFSTADGDLLIVPQTGELDVWTELGSLRASPGTIVVVPRAIKFAIGLPDGAARGWVAEVFGPRFRLPERGLIGSNGLADARHFLAPTAAYEDRLCPSGFEIVHKLGGKLFAATQEHSPFDVVAWHGVHVPFTYDLMLFNAMGSVTWDHVDPSIHTVLTAPLDDHGRAILDFVVFRGRWDVAEHSFRPPFMHRNAATEINGVVSAAFIESGYEPGCTFISPLLTAHGISTKSYDAQLSMSDDAHAGPRRIPDESLWIMFESALPFRLTPWARETPLVDAGFLSQFEGMRNRFDPTKP